MGGLLLALGQWGEASGAGERIVRVRTGVMELRVADEPLGSLLTEIARASRIVFQGEVEPSHRVSVDLRLPVKEGLSLLLKEYDHVILGAAPAAEGSGEDVVERVLIFKRKPNAARLGAGLQEAQSHAVIDTLAFALKSPQAEWRRVALETLAGTADSVVSDVLLQGVQSDPDPTNRLTALELLSAREDPETVLIEALRLALQDPVEDIRARARALVRHWGYGPRIRP